ncbi:MAG: hypothetical protein QM770_10885 [Tepidisphaeraceae bacterium]
MDLGERPRQPGADQVVGDPADGSNDEVVAPLGELIGVDLVEKRIDVGAAEGMCDL